MNTNLCFFREDYNNWYEYIVKVEDNVCKLKEYENEIKNDAGLDEGSERGFCACFYSWIQIKTVKCRRCLAAFIHRQTEDLIC